MGCLREYKLLDLDNMGRLFLVTVRQGDQIGRIFANWGDILEVFEILRKWRKFGDSFFVGKKFHFFPKQLVTLLVKVVQFFANFTFDISVSLKVYFLCLRPSMMNTFSLLLVK
jgi:hypothetical protein